MMLRIIWPANFDKEVMECKKNVLVAFMKNSESFADQVQELKNLSGAFGKSLKICLADEFFLADFFDRFGFTGTPFFLLFEEGKEKGRYFGYAERDDLMQFIEKMIARTEKV